MSVRIYALSVGYPQNNKFEWRCSLDSDSHTPWDIWEEHDCPDFVQGYEDEEHALEK